MPSDHLDRADIAAEVDARLAQQLRDHQARKEARRALRAEMGERRRHGLASRHARKLARLGGQRLSERNDDSRQDAEPLVSVTATVATQAASEAPGPTTPHRDGEDGAHRLDVGAHPDHGFDRDDGPDRDRRGGQPVERRRPRQRPSAAGRPSRGASRRPPPRRATRPDRPTPPGPGALADRPRLRRPPRARPPPGARWEELHVRIESPG